MRGSHYFPKSVIKAYRNTVALTLQPRKVYKAPKQQLRPKQYRAGIFIINFARGVYLEVRVNIHLYIYIPGFIPPNTVCLVLCGGPRSW